MPIVPDSARSLPLQVSHGDRNQASFQIVTVVSLCCQTHELLCATSQIIRSAFTLDSACLFIPVTLTSVLQQDIVSIFPSLT